MVDDDKLHGRYQTRVKVSAVLCEKCMHGLTTYMQDFPLVDMMSMCLPLNLREFEPTALLRSQSYYLM
jgi:hypothetical protein